MGVHNAELYNNLGLCCFYAQQYDMALTCMERALSLSEETETVADVWFNLGHIGLNLRKFSVFAFHGQRTKTKNPRFKGLSTFLNIQLNVKGKKTMV